MQWSHWMHVRRYRQAVRVWKITDRLSHVALPLRNTQTQTYTHRVLNLIFKHTHKVALSQTHHTSTHLLGLVVCDQTPHFTQKISFFNRDKNARACVCVCLCVCMCVRACSVSIFGPSFTIVARVQQTTATKSGRVATQLPFLELSVDVVASLISCNSYIIHCLISWYRPH